jgi:hypothetical protein
MGVCVGMGGIVGHGVGVGVRSGVGQGGMVTWTSITGGRLGAGTTGCGGGRNVAHEPAITQSKATPRNATPRKNQGVRSGDDC